MTLSCIPTGSWTSPTCLTLRRGEPVRDNVAGRVVTLSQEMVRLKSDPVSGACILLQGDVTIAGSTTGVPHSAAP